MADMAGLSGSIYVQSRDRELLWYGDAHNNGTPGWSTNTGNPISTGTWWVPIMFSNGFGKFYATDASGNLRWYQDLAHNGTASWAGGNVVWTGGWGSMQKATGGGNGHIYAVDASGNLRWYRDQNQNGTSNWAPGSGNIVGTGWTSMRFLCGNGNGILYATDSSGNLRWYRDAYQNGSWGWAAGSGNVIGTGWNGMTHMTCGGNGVIYGVDTSGNLRWYRDAYQNGSWGWAAGSGNIIGAGWNDISYTPWPENFGYGTMKVNGKAALGSRKMVVIPVEYSTYPAFTTQDLSYIDKLIFGSPSTPFTHPTNPASVSAFLTENSNGRFGITRASTGVLNKVTFTDEASVGGQCCTEKRIKAILTAASSGGFNFASYDTDLDAKVTPDELMVVIVENTTAPYQPDTRYSEMPLSLNGKEIKVQAAPINLTTPFGTVAHEVTHMLGTVDLYYSTHLNFRVSLMGDTGFDSTAQDPRHLDAWHKFRLGWIEPVVRRIHTAGTASVALSTAANPRGASLFWDRARGPSEYFIVEKRAQASAYDSSVGGTGLVIWHANGFADGRVVSRGAPSLAFGGSGLWGTNTVTPALTWNDGTNVAEQLIFTPDPLVSGDYVVTW